MNSIRTQASRIVSIAILLLILTIGIFLPGLENNYYDDNRSLHKNQGHRQLPLRSDLLYLYNDPKSIELRTDDEQQQQQQEPSSTSSSSSSPHSSLHYYFDPSPIKSKHYQDIEGLQPDGTYFLYHDKYNAGPSKECTPLLQSQNNNSNVTQIHLHYSTCQEFDKMFGNKLAYMYGQKMMANALRIPFKFTCGDGIEKDNNYSRGANFDSGAEYLMLLNEFDGMVGPPPIRDGVELTAEEVCNMCNGRFCGWFNQDLDLMGESMVNDWKYLTRPELVTMKDDDHDDAVIHLRLGDALLSRWGHNENKGVFPHATYVRLLMEAQQERGAIESIGIVTAPFKGKHVRGLDWAETSLSETIAEDLVKALQSAFPQATIRIHNNPKGTIMESLSRIVNAKKVATCGCSTFCPIPLLATKGIGYVYNSVGENPWVRKAAERYENIRLFETPMLNSMFIWNKKTDWQLDEKDVMKWLREQDATIGNVDIVEEPLFRYAVIN